MGEYNYNQYYGACAVSFSPVGDRSQNQPAGIWKRVNSLQFWKHFGLDRLPMIFKRRSRIFAGLCGAAEEKGSALVKKIRVLFLSFSKEVRRAADWSCAFLESCMRRIRRISGPSRRRIVRRAAFYSVAAAVLVGAIFTGMASVKTATVTVDGTKKYSGQVLVNDTDTLLKDAGVKLEKDSLISRGEREGRVDITVRTGRDVTVLADGEEHMVRVHYGETADDALKKAGVAVNPDDQVSPREESPLEDGSRVTVVRGLHVTVAADGRRKDALVYGGTVGQALNAAGVVADSDDKVSLNKDEAVRDGMKIAVNRVESRDVTAVQPIAYRTVTKKDASLSTGKTSVKQAGQNGEKTIVTRQTLVDGKVTGSKVISEKVTRQPVDRVVAVGTKTALAAVKTKKTKAGKKAAAFSARVTGGTLVDHRGKTVSYKKLLQGRCSCYTGGGTTSTGSPAAFGRVAVNPNLIPYGTRMYICSPDGKLVYGYAVAADTGGAAMRNVIIADLYYDTYAQCMKIGTRTMNVYIL